MPEEPKEPNPVSPELKTPPAAQPTASGKPTEVAVKSAEGAPLPSPAAAPPAIPSASLEVSKVEAAVKPVPSPVAAKPAPPPPKPEAPKPEPWNPALVQELKAQYGSGIREAATYLGQNYLVVDNSLVYEILLRLRDSQRCDYCVDITAVHYPKREAQFDIVYILYSFDFNQRIRIKTQIKDGESIRSACSIWPTANWLEREVFDMFGIVFDGHPDLKRILMPDGWKGYPLRKDYPILQQDQEWVKANIGIESAQ